MLFNEIHFKVKLAIATKQRDVFSARLEISTWGGELLRCVFLRRKRALLISRPLRFSAARVGAECARLGRFLQGGPTQARQATSAFEEAPDDF